VRFARTMRWAIVGFRDEKARAISSVVRPQSKRSVSAARASVESTGWQATKTRRSRSSPMSSSMPLDQGGFAIGPRDLLLSSHLAGELLVLALEELVAPVVIERAVLGGGHEPGARVVRNARPGPGLERGEESVLRELLGETDVAHPAREAGDDLGRLDLPDRFDRAVRGRCRSRRSIARAFG